ncbi:MAG: hypothetical protein D6675_10380 [Gemmatimonadetes bacterium]|nr:MAG: hypothetical protein D6675_10380 [Gemmatimonadota bacterium]
MRKPVLLIWGLTTFLLLMLIGSSRLSSTTEAASRSEIAATFNPEAIREWVRHDYAVDSLSSQIESQFVKFTRGYLLYQQEHWQAAQADFASMLDWQSFPLEDYAQFYLADIFRQQDLPDSAAVYLEAILKHHPQSLWIPEAGIWLGQYYVEREQYEPAIRVLAQALSVPSLDPEKKYECLTLLQRAYQEQDDRVPADSLKLYLWREFPLRHEGNRPANATLVDRFRRAELFFENGYMTSARKSYTALKSIARTPEDKARATLGEARARMNAKFRWRRSRNEKRMAELTVSNLKPLFQKKLPAELGSEVGYWLGRAYERLGREKSARNVYKATLERYANGTYSPKVRIELAELYLKSKQIHLADSLSQQLAVTEESVVSLWHLGWAAYQTNQFEFAERIFQEIGHLPDSRRWQTRGRYWAARSLERQYQWENAAILYQQIWDQFDYTYYGYASRSRLNQLPAGVRQRLSETEPDTLEARSSQLWINRFWNTWQRSWRRTGRSLPEIEVDVIPEFQRYHEWRAQLFMQLGLYEPALNELKALQREYPQRMAYYAQLAWVYQRMGDYRRSIIWLNRCPDPPDATEETYWHLYYPLEYWDIVKEKTEKYNISPFLLMGLIHQESAFDPKAKSIANARGLTQVIHSTGRIIARRLGVRGFKSSMLYDPPTSIEFGAYYLNLGLQKSGGNVAVAVAGYNAGVERAVRWWQERGDLEVDEWIETIPLNETRNYVKRVIRNYYAYQDIYGEDVQQVNPAGYLTNRIPFVGDPTIGGWAPAGRTPGVVE